MEAYIHQNDDCPHFTLKNDEVVNLLSKMRILRERLPGAMASLSFCLRNKAQLETLTLDVLKSSEMQWEYLNPDQVRSSIARNSQHFMLGNERKQCTPASDRLI